MSKVWFTADTHFSQQRTLELSRRPFYSTSSMDKIIVNNWNTVVDDDDVVFHLGDFGNPVIISDLAGAEIYLLPGNYDTPEIQEELVKRDLRVTILDFQPWSLEVPLYLDEEFDPDDELPGKIYLVHEPEKATNEKLFYLYGHIHQLQMVKRNGLNVGTDCHQFRPIDWEAIVFYYLAIVNYYDENVFMEKLG